MNMTRAAIEYDAVKSGAIDFIPIGFFVTIFGAAFGVAASQLGLSQTSAMLMSATVFAGASQFGALELWGDQVSLVALIITMFAINARHILMGAVIYPYLQHLEPWKRYGVMLFATDSNWAVSVQEFSLKNHTKALGILFGGGMCLWIFWVLGTWLGFYFGNAISHPETYGVDMVMACFLLSIAISSEKAGDKEGWKDKKTLTIWGVAAVSSIAAYLWLPENSNVIVGALVGGVVGVFMQDDIIQGERDGD